MRFKQVQLFAFRTISQIGVSYADSGLSRNTSAAQKRAPRAGDRFPWMRPRLVPDRAVEDLFTQLDDTRFNLLVFGQPALPPDALSVAGDLLSIHAMGVDPANDTEMGRTGIPARSYYVLRPDGHIGLCGVDLESRSLTDYLVQVVGLRIGQPQSRAADAGTVTPLTGG